MRKSISFVCSGLLATLCLLSVPTDSTAQVTEKDSLEAVEEDAKWIPTGVWPFLNRRFMPAEVVTGLFSVKKTYVPCNIHVGNQSLCYLQNDTVMEADPININIVRFKNGDLYQPVGNTFAKVIRNDSTVGKVLRVRTVDKKRFESEGRSVSNLGTVSMGGGSFGGMFNMDFASQYEPNPEEKQLPVLDTFYFIYNMEIFPVSDKEVLRRIDPKRKKEYRDFTRRAEILKHSEESVLKIWDTFFVHY